jgi:hypothetical protein
MSAASGVNVAHAPEHGARAVAARLAILLRQAWGSYPHRLTAGVSFAVLCERFFISRHRLTEGTMPMLISYRFTRGAGYSILSSLAFALFNRKPPEIQKLLHESDARFMELQTKLDERRNQSRPNSN